MGESFSKKDKANKKKKDKQDKAQKMLDRKSNNNKGKGLNDMLAYVDENGNLSSTPPNAAARKEIALEDIQLGAAPIQPEETQRTGTVSFFNSTKGFGFITDDKSGEDVFFHTNQLAQPVKEKDRVSFERERTPRGYSAVRVVKTK
ncbi:cold-shock protein [Dinghuibacter silviterrae]|uniref:Cold shock CspA family protein n=1 Tax=Dinghuibacter silviterrae TaxID=1539049 RepID=A0A4R8DHU5_9BACT|nr:cold shock domain-containing protein [Dinghuibacter silviterrae]TDW97038.1 cold shock CspA family protein [Dinghuibacter silviterrae]